MHTFPFPFAPGFMAVALLTGCVSMEKHALPHEPRPLGSGYAAMNPYPELHAEGDRMDVAEPTGTLRLEDALAASLMRHPELAAVSFTVRAVEARALQAGTLPNPVLGVDLEEYDRAGEGFDSAETAVGLSQTFELAGKRRWRKRMAQSEGELAGWDYESKRLDIFAETSRRFVNVLAAQERLRLARSDVERAQETDRAVSERVKAGNEAPLQASKSEAELEMARLDQLAADNALRVARKRLAAMWGAEDVLFEQVEGRLDTVLEDIPSLDRLRDKLELNPALQRWDAKLRLRRAALAAEKAERIPDLEASVGYVQFEEDGTDAVALGIGIPLPVFDRNRGNIIAAEQELAKIGSDRLAAEVALAADLAETHANLTNAHHRVGTLQAKVVPAMEQAFEAVRSGYQSGKFSFLEMLDAQRGLFEARAKMVDALVDYQAALIVLQRITATSIEE